MSFKENNHMTARDEPMSFEQVYLQFIRPVYIAAYGILKNQADAEDVAQEVFLTYFQMEDKKRIHNLENYLMKMARNKALDCQKRKNREIPSEELPTKSELLPSAHENRQSVSSQVIEKIEQLPSEERQIILMRVKSGMGFVQISKVMGMSVPAVYRRYRKAISILQKSLKGSEHDE